MKILQRNELPNLLLSFHLRTDLEKKRKKFKCRAAAELVIKLRLLSISSETVSTHRKNLLNKTKARNTAEMISLAIRKGWV